MEHSTVTTPVASKAHRCTSCGETIEAGTKYVKWTTFDDGAFTNKMHQECHDAHAEAAREDGYGDWEYSPYDHQRGKADLK